MLSDDFALAVTAVRARSLLESGTRFKHSTQSPIGTVLLDGCTIGCLRQDFLHNRGTFAHFDASVEVPMAFAAIRENFKLARLSNASIGWSQTIGVVTTPMGDRLYTVAFLTIDPPRTGSSCGNVLSWKQGDSLEYFVVG